MGLGLELGRGLGLELGRGLGLGIGVGLGLGIGVGPGLILRALRVGRDVEELHLLGVRVRG